MESPRPGVNIVLTIWQMDVGVSYFVYLITSNERHNKNVGLH